MKIFVLTLRLFLLVIPSTLSAFSETIEFPGSKVHIYVEDNEYVLTYSELVDWVQRSVEIVSTFYGRFPTKEAYVAISGSPGKGVINGLALGDAGAVVNIKIGLSTALEDIETDWVMVHELIHLAFPKLNMRHHWIEEGLSVYIESVARAQAGYISAESVWRNFVRGMPNGLPQRGDKGLDYTPTWGRTYWGGALFFLLADIEILRRSGGVKSLKDGLRAIVGDGFNITMDSDPRELFLIADEEIGFPVLTELYNDMRDKPVHVDLDRLWRELGIVYANEKVQFLGDAQDADVRKMITHPNQ